MIDLREASWHGSVSVVCRSPVSPDLPSDFRHRHQGEQHQGEQQEVFVLLFGPEDQAVRQDFRQSDVLA
ncbi:MAG TPA: hypothetical protein DEW46_12530, partial [Verrucomicrobia bacterium]|nr:hypothetical protein [Verrucomicrobiota bacterium]